MSLTRFNYHEHAVRVIHEEEGAVIVLADICQPLELNPASVAARIDDEDKGYRIVDTPGGPQRVLVVNESGLYTAMLRSRKPEARAFRRWITSEVLPSIRQHGAYVAPNATLPGVAAAANHSGAFGLANDLLLTIDRLFPDLARESLQAVAADVLSQVGIALPAPPVERMYEMHEIAKPYGITPQKAGKLCAPYKLQTPEFGCRYLITVDGSQREQFRYNERGKAAVEAVLDDKLDRNKVVVLGDL